MTIKLTIFFLLLSNIAFTQYSNQPAPTQFDKFITQPNIEWAAYANDTVRFEKIRFNNLLLRRLSKEEIKASLPLSLGINDRYPILLKKKKDIDNKVLYPICTLPIFDSTGTAVDLKIEPYKIDTASSYLTTVTQILFVENGELKTYVPWVSANMIPIVTSSGINLGIADYFSACFNYKYNYRPGRPDKILFLEQTKKKIRLDSAGIESRLKELYGRNLLQTLWPQIVKNKYLLLSSGSNSKLASSDLNTNLIDSQKIVVPVFDENGNVASQLVKSQPISPDIFTQAELLQDWYYDITSNMVFNKVKEMTLCAKKWSVNGQDKEPSPILKIIFH
jgi:hypothetical protein